MSTLHSPCIYRTSSAYSWFLAEVTTSWNVGVPACRRNKATVRYGPCPRGIPTTTADGRDEGDVRVGLAVDKGDVKAKPGVDKAVVRVGFNVNKGVGIGKQSEGDFGVRLEQSCGPVGAKPICGPDKTDAPTRSWPDENGVRVGSGNDKGVLRAGCNVDKGVLRM